MPYKPTGYTDVAPYLTVRDAEACIGFLQRVFEATPLRQLRDESGGVVHAEVRIGDTVVMLSDGTARWPAQPANVHIYVPDVDATFARALSAGAEVLQEPVQKDDPDRRGGFRDGSGISWWIATQQEAD
jgi:uncharacterized glyoxalase superfamily protein PhnB